MKAYLFLLIGILYVKASCRYDANIVDAASIAFTEGPVWDPRTGSIFFSDIPGDRIMRLPNASEPRTVVNWKAASEWKNGLGKPNGLAFDKKGRLIVCESVGRRVVRIELDGNITVLADSYNNLPFNSPNDVVVDAWDRIYFTDSSYGMNPIDIKLKEAVYRIDIDPLDRPFLISRIISDLSMPNGIGFSPTFDRMYVTSSSPDENKLWSFIVNGDGTVAPVKSLLHDFVSPRGPDGLCVDKAGNIYVAAGASSSQNSYGDGGIYVFSPTGKQLTFIDIPEDTVTNCCFGGVNQDILFITAGKTLFKTKPDLTPSQTDSSEGGVGGLTIALIVVVIVVVLVGTWALVVYFRRKKVIAFSRLNDDTST